MSYATPAALPNRGPPTTGGIVKTRAVKTPGKGKKGGIRISKAAAAAAAATTTYSYFTVALLGILVLQNTSTTLLARHTRITYNYDVSHMLLMSEVMKFIASTALEFRSQSVKNESWMLSFHTHIWNNPLDSLKLAVPSGLYLLQNSLVYYSISHVPVPLFQVTQQTKLVITAILSVLFLKRSYSCVQWSSIVSLCVGAVICIRAMRKDEDEESENTFSAFALLLLVGSNLSSALAGIYLEIVIKGKDKKGKDVSTLPSIWIRNIQLSFFTICIICSQLTIKSLNTTSDKQAPFFYDFTPILWVQISLFAFGGILVASVIKYTDSVCKGLATGVSLILSSALAVKIETPGEGLPMEFMVGAALAIGGCFVFANPTVVVIKKVETSHIKICLFIAMAMSISLQPFLSSYNTNVMDFRPVVVSSGIVDQESIHQYLPVPTDYKESLYFHVFLVNHQGSNCGGCNVLWELHDVVAALNVTVQNPASFQIRCLSEQVVMEQMELNKTIVMVLRNLSSSRLSRLQSARRLKRLQTYQTRQPDIKPLDSDCRCKPERHTLQPAAPTTSTLAKPVCHLATA